MEFLLIAAIAYGVIAYDLIQKRSPAGAAGSPPPPDFPPGAGLPPGTDPGTTYGTPLPVSPPAVVPKPPGAYPAGTPGTLPLTLSVVGGDGYGIASVQPGGEVGPQAGASKTFWFGPGTFVTFRARLAGGFPPPVFEAFDHWQSAELGSSRDNPYLQAISYPAVVRAYFSFAGFVGQ